MAPGTLLPESRLKASPKGVLRHADYGNMEQIFCASCGDPYGHVPTEMIDQVFALCNPCAEKYGDDAHHLHEVDPAVYEAIERETQAAAVARQLTPELAIRVELESGVSALSALKRDWDRRISACHR